MERELGYDEIKPEMLDRQETIRSRTVDGVGQELWGILLAYNLIRLEIERTADDLGVEPTRISFVSTMRLVCATWVWCSIASAGAIPARLNTMRELFTRLVLPARRSTRSHPRAVKIKMTNYARKLPIRETALNRTTLGLTLVRGYVAFLLARRGARCLPGRGTRRKSILIVLAVISILVHFIRGKRPS